MFVCCLPELHRLAAGVYVGAVVIHSNHQASMARRPCALISYLPAGHRLERVYLLKADKENHKVRFNHEGTSGLMAAQLAVISQTWKRDYYPSERLPLACPLKFQT